MVSTPSRPLFLESTKPESLDERICVNVTLDFTEHLSRKNMIGARSIATIAVIIWRVLTCVRNEINDFTYVSRSFGRSFARN